MDGVLRNARALLRIAQESEVQEVQENPAHQLRSVLALGADGSLNVVVFVEVLGFNGLTLDEADKVELVPAILEQQILRDSLAHDGELLVRTILEELGNHEVDQPVAGILQHIFVLVLLDDFALLPEDRLGLALFGDAPALVGVGIQPLHLVAVVAVFLVVAVFVLVLAAHLHRGPADELIMRAAEVAVLRVLHLLALDVQVRARTHALVRTRILLYTDLGHGVEGVAAGEVGVSAQLLQGHRLHVVGQKRGHQHWAAVLGVAALHHHVDQLGLEAAVVRQPRALQLAVVLAELRKGPGLGLGHQLRTAVRIAGALPASAALLIAALGDRHLLGLVGKLLHVGVEARVLALGLAKRVG